MMQRRPEPELMDEPEQAAAYAETDFEQPNAQFVALLEARFGARVGGRILDIGCGPGDIALRLARRYPDAVVEGLDGSAPMLAHAEAALAREPHLATRVRFIEDILPSSALRRGYYDCVISNSLLHHLHDPQVLWRTVQEVTAPGAAVYVMDLFRPHSETRAAEIVQQYAADASEILRRDFYHSLLAAFTPDEVRDQLRASGLTALTVETVSDRHLLVYGRT